MSFSSDTFAISRPCLVLSDCVLSNKSAFCQHIKICGSGNMNVCVGVLKKSHAALKGRRKYCVAEI
ncbi:MAG TPA: hypothetical protein DDY57_06375 [Franconibacter pulveris]|nr:hypothetical protein [Franconibacter pulveris]